MAEPISLRAATAAAPATAGVIDTTTQTFAKDVLEASQKQPVLVDFWAPWCGPCRTLGPIIERVVAATSGRVRLVKMNIDDHPAIAGQLGIQSIPAVIAFVGGRPVDGFVGALPESQVRAFVTRLLEAAGDTAAEDEQAVLDSADRQLEAGNARGAAKLYDQVLRNGGDNVRALTGLVNATIASGDLARARQLLATIPASKTSDARVVAASAQLALAEEAARLGDPRKLRSRLAADPSDFESAYDLALIESAAGNRDAAVELLIGIIRRDRGWEDEKARKRLVQFFDAWGPKDKATLAGRRRLSSLLFA
jgi:putative thioredoxin